jgi:hypothetical protein
MACGTLGPGLKSVEVRDHGPFPTSLWSATILTRQQLATVLLSMQGNSIAEIARRVHALRLRLLAGRLL